MHLVNEMCLLWPCQTAGHHILWNGKWQGAMKCQCFKMLNSVIRQILVMSLDAESRKKPRMDPKKSKVDQNNCWTTKESCTYEQLTEPTVLFHKQPQKGMLCRKSGDGWAVPLWPTPCCLFFTVSPCKSEFLHSPPPRQVVAGTGQLHRVTNPKSSS